MPPILIALLAGAVGWYAIGWIRQGTAPGTELPPAPPATPTGADANHPLSVCAGGLAGGAGSGALAGLAAGGPIGAMIGAMAGTVAASRNPSCNVSGTSIQQATADRVAALGGASCVPQRPCGALRFLHRRACDERDAWNAAIAANPTCTGGHGDSRASNAAASHPFATPGGSR